MLQISVRFSPEQVKAMRSGTFAALQQEIERRLTPRYPHLWLNIGKSSQTALDVSGARSDQEKSDSMNTLEAIWQDDTWLPE
ncbi:DinI-like family protein [Klebsiella pneumoniae]|nr:DinI-like family protein [Klebsiella pneumoniae]PUH22635.1 DinI family protein [Klebsiella pneumoniae]